MSQTVVVTEAERARQMVNEVNKAFRHCRIGKVTRKSSSEMMFNLLFPSLPVIPNWASKVSVITPFGLAPAVIVE